jgi:predicted dehydrogenase
MKEIRLGIIGLGYIGNIHLRHSLRLKNARVAAVADISANALRKAKEIGVKKTYINYRDLVKDPEIDAVIISLPTHMHLESAIETVEHHKDVFLEKPIARNVAEAEEIIKAARQNSARLMMGYPMRFNTSFRELKKEVTEGSLGEIEIANAKYLSSGPFFHRAEGYAPVPVPEWWFNKDLTGGGALIDLGSHMINLLRWYFGEISDIQSCLGYRFRLDFEDSAICLARFKTGTTATITVGWFSQAYSSKIELNGSLRQVTVQHAIHNPIVVATQMLTTGVSKFFQPHFLELQHFVNCLLNEREPSPTGNDGLKDLEAISLAYKNQIQLT